MTEHISKELAQRLWDKGFRGTHYCLWMESCVDGKPFVGDPENSVAHKRLFPAYTFTELTNIIPLGIGNKQWWWAKYDVMPKRFVTGYGNINGSQWSHESPAEAAGLLVEWLIDNGYEVKG
jgi:hypothetical protein